MAISQNKLKKFWICSDMYFKKRQPEPTTMEKEEQEAFQKLSTDNYKRWFVPLVDDIVEKTDIKKDAVVLDVGCGPGFLEKAFHERGHKFSIVGIDISKDAIKLAKQNSKNNRKVTFKQGSVYKIPLSEKSVDGVVCKDTFHHFDNPKKALKEMLRVLKDGGFLYIQDLRRDTPHYLLKRVIPPESIIQKLQYYSVRASYTKKELEKILENINNVKIHELSTRHITRKIQNRYKKIGVDMKLLREAFQNRYRLVAQKK